MKAVDPDIVAALKSIASGVESRRLTKVRKRHDKETQRRFETQMEFLSDEVESVVPRGHPLFGEVLLLTVIRKVQHLQQEPEVVIDFEEFPFPKGW
jgi:hypothetical protein